MSAKTPVVGYVRCSTEEQGERYGPGAQRAAIQDYCKRERLRLVRVFEDIGVSRATPLEDREGLLAALDFVSSDDAAAVVVARHDRFGESAEAIVAERAFRDAGAGVLCVQGVNGDDPVVDYLREQMYALAKLERRLIVARMMAGKRAKAEAGHAYAFGGRPPLGYEGRDGQLHPKPDELEVVRWIFARVARDGWSIRRVAEALTREGTLGRRWHATQVARILRNPIYKSGPSGARAVDGKIWNAANARLHERRAR